MIEAASVAEIAARHPFDEISQNNDVVFIFILNMQIVDPNCSIFAGVQRERLKYS